MIARPDPCSWRKHRLSYRPGHPTHPNEMKKTAKSQVVLFTDGACSGNPGPGGWCFILRHRATGKQISRTGAERDTTNNRMELTAVICGLEALKRPAQVELVTDSQYVGKGMTEWMPKWKANGWRRGRGTAGRPVLNQDLWQRLDQLLAKHHISYTPVLGHAGHPENEQCDARAVEAYQQFL